MTTLRRQVTNQTQGWLSQLGWTLFAASFGYTEAVVVVYIRRLLGERPGLDYAQIFARKHLEFSSAGISADMAHHALLSVERTREVATLLLLAGAALGGGRSARERVALFLFTFAVWDLTYYGFLLGWTGFPQNLFSTDIYFLVPLAWYGPVWLPLLIMPLLIAASVILRRPR